MGKWRKGSGKGEGKGEKRGTLSRRWPFHILVDRIESVLNVWSPGGSAVLESDRNFKGHRT